MADSLSDADVLEELKQWKVNRPSKPSRLLPKSGFGGPADRSYTLKNGKVRKFLQHEEQSVGINLGWTDDAEPSTAAKVARWFFARSGASDKPLVYGETLAIGNGGSPSFIRNKKRTAGVDLDWSTTPVFEWKLVGGEPGTTIDPADYLAIYNEKAGEFLIFFNRTAGGDIGWPSSKTWGEQIPDVVVEKAKKRAEKILLG